MATTPTLPMTKALTDLLYQSLETELGGVRVYETALRCVQNEDLKEEWEKYLDQTRRHVELSRELLDQVLLDPDADVASREPIRIIGAALVEAMEAALEAGDMNAAELTAADCVVEAETKDHQNWSLLAALVKEGPKDIAALLRPAVEEVEGEEDEHLYHSRGWGRELWIAALGMPAVLPPPEERLKVRTAIGAERAKGARKDMKSED